MARFRSRSAYGRGEAAGAEHSDVALCRHRHSGHWRRGDFSLRPLSEKAIVLLGAPGSGKGTQAEMITRQFGIPVTSPGAILAPRKRSRDAAWAWKRLRYPAGRTGSGQDHRPTDRRLAAACTAATVLSSMVFRARFRRPKACRAFLHEHHTPLDLAIWLDVSEETVRDRIAEPTAMPRLRFHHQRRRARSFAERPVCPYCEGRWSGAMMMMLRCCKSAWRNSTPRPQPLAAFYRRCRRLASNRRQPRPGSGLCATSRG